MHNASCVKCRLAGTAPFCRPAADKRLEGKSGGGFKKAVARLLANSAGRAKENEKMHFYGFYSLNKEKAGAGESRRLRFEMV